jgi:hypothetical protein
MNKKDVLQFTTKTLQKWIQTDYKLTTKTLRKVGEEIGKTGVAV